MKQNLLVLLIITGLALLTTLFVSTSDYGEVIITFMITFTFWFLMLVSVIETK
jgi:hypothetical protein